MYFASIMISASVIVCKYTHAHINNFSFIHFYQQTPQNKNEKHDFLFNTRFTGKILTPVECDLIYFYFVRKRIIFYRAHWTSIFNFIAKIKIIKITKAWENFPKFKIVLYGLEIEFWKFKTNVPDKSVSLIAIL